MYLKSIQKEYPNGLVRSIVYEKGITFSPPTCRTHLKINCQICYPRNKDNPPSASSIQRSKSKIADIVLSNNFSFFATFTFDPKKVDSLDLDYSKKVFSKWLNNQRAIFPDLAYLAVPELHPNSGRLHFHVLFESFSPPLVDSGKISNGRPIYNVSSWRFGFSTFVKIGDSIDDRARVANYIKKYITKDFIEEGNKRRYWASRNLKKPEKYYNHHRELEHYPLFKKDSLIFDDFVINSYYLPIGFLRDNVSVLLNYKEDRLDERFKH